MEWTGLNELREKYLSFFESKGHLRMASANLIPNGDNSLLLINSGMAPLKKFFLGTEKAPRNRVTTCQKCIRTPDIERVGKTARHGTYFEMLGNFSFGDYFKREAISWAWEFLTGTLAIPADRLWITVFESDDEAADIWHNEIGIPSERIIRLGKADNFWEHGSGPCGPCSEIHFDRGDEYGPFESFEQASDCDRVIEIWNLVFSQFDSDGKGTYTEMAHKNIDTGMGLERLACAMQGVDNLFEVDTVRNIMQAVSDIGGVKYKENEKSDVSLRVITDHIRSTTFMVGDGVTASNTGRGYVLRRLLRRAARHGRLLGIKEPFLYRVCDRVIDENKCAYPELEEKREYIKKLILSEEEQFAKTVDSGLEVLSKMLGCLPEGGTLSGEDAFKLSDTYGFPIDLTCEIAEEKGIAVDREGFDSCVDEARQRSREDRLSKGGSSWDEDAMAGLTLPKTEFVGYDYSRLSENAQVIGVFKGGSETDSVNEGEEAVIILDRTPFYAESGGQVGDSGVITIGESRFSVTDVKKTPKGHFLHMGVADNGGISKGDSVTASVDVTRRYDIMRNHTAAHLLQAALRSVLGDHVHQAGSYVDAHRCRFDFSHFEPVTHEQLAKIEAIVNENIFAAIPVTMTEMPIEEARKMGSMALFGEKYGDIVRVVEAKGVSVEFCGGTHIDNTARLGLFHIISENSVAAGVRRIEAVTGAGVLGLTKNYYELLCRSAAAMKIANAEDVPGKCVQLAAEVKALEGEKAELNAKLAASQTGDIMANAVTVGDMRVASVLLKDVPGNALREMGDKARDKYPDGVVVFASVSDKSRSLLCVCGAKAIEAGANAGVVVKAVSALTGGKGGGKKESAMAGAGEAMPIEQALAAVPDIVREIVNR